MIRFMTILVSRILLGSFLLSSMATESHADSSIEDNNNPTKKLNPVDIPFDDIDRLVLFMEIEEMLTGANFSIFGVAFNGPATQPEHRSLEKRQISIQKDLFNNLEIKDSNGYRKTIRKDLFNNWLIEDSRGYTKTVKRDIFQNLTIEDNKGNSTTIKKDILGNFTVEDNNGNSTTVKKDIFGNYTAKDNSGNTTSIKKNIFGNLVIKRNYQTVEQYGLANEASEHSQTEEITIKTGVSGNITIENDRGEKIKIRKNIFGDSILNFD